LVVGKPKTGKTAFCKQLAKLLDIEHVESQKCIENIFEKIKKNEESPQTDEEGNPKEFLHSTERRVLNDLQAGKNIEHADLLVLLNLQM
jgi:tRNA uridine 5-carbamoylmethylation protein Kti12